jgi:hypothetical protein
LSALIGVLSARWQTQNTQPPSCPVHRFGWTVSLGRQNRSRR